MPSIEGRRFATGPLRLQPPATARALRPRPTRHPACCTITTGDRSTSSGALSGGYIDTRRSRLRAHAEVREVGAQIQQLESERVDIRNRAAQQAAQLSGARSTLQAAQAAEARAAMQLEQACHSL